MKKMNCNPNVFNKSINKDTCYTDTALIQIKNAYNKNHPENRIKSTLPSTVFNELKTKLSKCNSEDCWLEELSPKDKKYLDQHIFAPYQPTSWKKNPREWLSNIDILNVLKQYEETFSNFKFIGPTSIDFDTVINDTCVSEELCKIQIKKFINSGINKIGIIFNLDKHDEGGSHWVSMFINIQEGIIFYFDSAANDIPNEIQKLVNVILKQSKYLKIPMKYYTNLPRQHQQGNSECGMYSLYFIITMLDDIQSMKSKIDIFKKKNISDKFVESFRSKYFNS
jgi:hypothetical protein